MDHFCQKKRNEPGYDILKEGVSKYDVFRKRQAVKRRAVVFTPHAQFQSIVFGRCLLQLKRVYLFFS